MIIVMICVAVCVFCAMTNSVLEFMTWLEAEKQKELQEMLKKAQIEGAALMAKRQNRFIDEEGNVDLIQCRNYIRKMERQQKLKLDRIEAIQFEVIE